MATFKVGDKVRFARGLRPSYQHVIGGEGVVATVPGELLGPEKGGPWDCTVNFRSPLGHRYDGVNCMFAELEPILSDPSAERFIERIKRLAREPMPLEKERA